MKRSIQLIAEATEEKIWAALAVLSGSERWVSVDQLGEFLKGRQAEAASVQYSADAPAARYALVPGVARWPVGWDDHHIAQALSAALDRKLIEHRVDAEGLNHFRSIAQDDHDLWGLFSYATPTLAQWSEPPLQLESA